MNTNYMCQAKKGQTLVIPKGAKIKLAFYRTPTRRHDSWIRTTDVLTKDYQFDHDAYFTVINVQ